MAERTTESSQPPRISIPGSSKGGSPSTAASGDKDNIYDQLVAKSLGKSAPSPNSLLGVSHPALFRKGTLIEIPDIDPEAALQRERQRQRRSKTKPSGPERFVAIAIKDSPQTIDIIEWAIRQALVPGRDKVVLINVRPAVNGLIGDLVSSNSDKEVAEREKSHGLLKKYASIIKAEGYPIKGVSIRGVDIRGELVRKLIELKCDMLIMGRHASKSMKERFIGCKVNYLIENSPCPVTVVGGNSRLFPGSSSPST